MKIVLNMLENIKNKNLVFLSALVFFILIRANFADPLDNWHPVNPLSRGQALNNITFGNNMFIAVGRLGAILTSSDGAEWSLRDSGTTRGLRGITCGNNTFVAVGDNQIKLLSYDGVNWSNQDADWRPYRVFGRDYVNNMFISGEMAQALEDDFEWQGKNNLSPAWGLRAVTYGNGMFAAVGDFGAIFTSTDGVNWISRISGTSNQLTGIAWGNNMFVAVGWDRETRSGLILASRDGAGWTIRNFEEGSFFRFTGITYGGNIFVAAGDGRIFTSADGVKWSAPRTVNAFFNGITYGNSTFVAAGEDGETGNSVIITSADAMNWKRRRLGANNGIYGVTYGNNTFIAVGGGTILQSDNLSGSRYQDELLGVVSYVYPKPVRLSNEFRIKIVFNKSLDVRYPPAVVLIGNGRVSPMVEKGGEIKTTSLANDTYITPDIILDKNMAGEITIAVNGARDNDGNVMKNTAEETFTLIPEKGFNLDKPESMIIEEGNITFSRRINIKFNITGAREMMVTEDVTFKNSKWEPFNSAKVFQLSGNEGEKVVYFKFKDENGNISVPVARIVTFIIPLYSKPRNIQSETPVIK